MHCILFGATGGIGSHLTARLLARGWRVTAVSRQPAGLGRPQLGWVRCDLAVRGQVEALARRLPAAERVVFAHGVFTDRPAYVGSEELQHRINATAVRWFCDAAARPGRLVLVGSHAWRRSRTEQIQRCTGLAAYRASKRALFFHGLQLAERGWEVHTVHPGVARTSIAKASGLWVRSGYRLLQSMVGVTPEHAAHRVEHLVVEPELAVPSGTYWYERTPHPELARAHRDEALQWVA